MALAITSDQMTSDLTSHTAHYSQHAAANGQGAWIVSWLPLRLLDRNRAITAMTIAEAVSTHQPASGDLWPSILNTLARELHLTGEDALRRVRELGGS